MQLYDCGCALVFWVSRYCLQLYLSVAELSEVYWSLYIYNFAIIIDREIKIGVEVSNYISIKVKIIAEKKKKKKKI